MRTLSIPQATIINRQYAASTAYTRQAPSIQATGSHLPLLPLSSVTDANHMWMTPLFTPVFHAHTHDGHPVFPMWHSIPHGITTAPTPGLQHVGQVASYNSYINDSYGDNVAYAPALRAPRTKKLSSQILARRLHVIRRPRFREPVAYNYKCGRCEAWFTRSSERHRHIQSGCVNGQQKEWQCPLCLKMYSRSDSRGRHCDTQHHMSYKDAIELVRAHSTISEREGVPVPPDND